MYLKLHDVSKVRKGPKTLGSARFHLCMRGEYTLERISRQISAQVSRRPYRPDHQDLHHRHCKEVMKSAGSASLKQSMGCATCVLVEPQTLTTRVSDTLRRLLKAEDTRYSALT